MDYNNFYEEELKIMNEICDLSKDNKKLFNQCLHFAITNNDEHNLRLYESEITDIVNDEWLRRNRNKTLSDFAYKIKDNVLINTIKNCNDVLKLNYIGIHTNGVLQHNIKYFMCIYKLIYGYFELKTSNVNLSNDDKVKVTNEQIITPINAITHIVLSSIPNYTNHTNRTNHTFEQINNLDEMNQNTFRYSCYLVMYYNFGELHEILFDKLETEFYSPL